MPSRNPQLRFAPYLIAFALIAASSASPAQGQARSVIIAVPDAFPAIDARALLLRAPDRDVLVLPPDGATVEALSVALSALGRARERAPTPDGGEMIPITGFAVTAGPDAEERTRLLRILKSLERRPPTSIGDLGPGRWIPYPGR